MNEIQKYEEQPFSLILTTDDFEKVFHFKSPVISDFVLPTSCPPGGCTSRYFLGRTKVKCDEQDYEFMLDVKSGIGSNKALVLTVATFYFINGQGKTYNFDVALPQDTLENIGSFEWIKDSIIRGKAYMCELTDESIKEAPPSIELYAPKDMPVTEFISLAGRRLKVNIGQDELYEQDISDFYRRATGIQTEQIINHFGQEYKITQEEAKKARYVAEGLSLQGLDVPICEGEIDLDCTVKLSDPSAINSFRAYVVSEEGEIFLARSVSVDVMPPSSFSHINDSDNIVIIVSDEAHETIKNLFIVVRLPKDRAIVQETPESLIVYINHYPGIMIITYKDGTTLRRVRSEKTFQVAVNE